MLPVVFCLFLATTQVTVGTCAPQDRCILQRRYCRERYRVLLDKGEPSGRAPPPILAPPITTDPIEEPLRMLPQPYIPKPRVVSHKCICFKTVMRPQVFQRIIAVPKVLRFVKKSYRPIIEKVVYCSKPVGAETIPGLTPLNARYPATLGAHDHFL